MGTTDKNGINSIRKNMLLTLALWCVLCTGCMTVMLAAAADKTVVIADTAAGSGSYSGKRKGEQKKGQMPGDGTQAGIGTEAVQADIGTDGALPDLDPETVLIIQQDASLENRLCIPLEKGTKAEQVTMENRYMEQELWISIEKADPSFYRENPITGDSSPVRQCRYEVTKDGMLIKMQMETVWEYRSTMENDSLNIALSSPREQYRQIVVVDPVCAGGDQMAEDAVPEEDITLQVAKLVQQKVDQTDIRTYLTRSEDSNVTEEQKLRLIQAVKPDLLLQIGVQADAENAEQYGIAAYYNEEYYLPEFGNVEWADMVTRNVTIAASNRALGLFPAGNDSFLKLLDMPAAEICLGYLTNAREKTLLFQESYQEKLAQGIAEAILEVYTNTYTLR